MLAEPEVERNAVELPSIQHFAGIFVAVRNSGDKPDLTGDMADDGAVDKRVFDNQQAARLLDGLNRSFIRIRRRIPTRHYW